MAGRWRRMFFGRGAGRRILLKSGRGDRLLIFFFVGLSAGALAANVFYPGLKDQAAYYVGMMTGERSGNAVETVSLFFSLCRQRGLQMLALWILSLTVYSGFFTSLFCAGAGVSVGVVMAVLTAQKGILGLPFFVLTVFPQALFYVPAWCLLLMRENRPGGRIRVLPLAAVLLCTAAGSASEAWLNPYFLRFFI